MASQYHKLLQFNMFQNQRFGLDTSVETRAKLGRIATRLHICLYIIGVTVLIVYTLIHPRIVAKTSYHPTLTTAAKLHQNYFDTIECPCSRTQIARREFATIDVRFHQVNHPKEELKGNR